MNDTITIRGIVATAPRHLVTGTGLSITSFRLASPSRRWDRSTSAWMNGDTNWFTVTAFRTLATNVQESVVKGDRVIVTGRLRVRPWEREQRSGISVEIDGDGIGHDLAFGRSQWRKVLRHVADETSGPGEHPTDEERGVAHAAGALGADPVTGEIAEDDDRDDDDRDDEGHEPDAVADVDGRAAPGTAESSRRSAPAPDRVGFGQEARLDSAMSAPDDLGTATLAGPTDHVEPVF